jgi:hypothetical protein
MSLALLALIFIARKHLRRQRIIAAAAGENGVPAKRRAAALQRKKRVVGAREKAGIGVP